MTDGQLIFAVSAPMLVVLITFVGNWLFAQQAEKAEERRSFERKLDEHFRDLKHCLAEIGRALHRIESEQISVRRYQSHKNAG